MQRIDLDSIRDLSWVGDQIANLTTTAKALRPSEAAEQFRELPPATTDHSGPFSWDLCPYFREPLDLLGPDSPYYKVVIEKGVQMAYTVAILENFIFYQIHQVKTRPVLFATANDELCETRITTNIVPMIQSSGLSDRIMSHDQLATRKAGKTNTRISWEGGGRLEWIGAVNADKFRSLPYPAIAMDEVDAWKNSKDGDPIDLISHRGKTYRKSGTLRILIGSTPSTIARSRIHREFLTGDQREYFVCCLRCGEPQRIRWRRESKEDGVVTGIVWDMQGESFDPKSVRYLCKFCSHPHEEDDKYKLLSAKHGAHWRALEPNPVDPGCASFNAPALLSIMQPWSDWVVEWRKAVGNGNAQAPEHPEKMQVFYNNCLAKPYTDFGRGVKLSEVTAHRRDEYALGQIPSRFSQKVCGSPILFLTAAVDVHPDALYIAIFGWSAWSRAWLIDYVRLPDGKGADGQALVGNSAMKGDPLTWGALDQILLSQNWVDDMGYNFGKLGIVVIDSGTITDQVYEYCAEYAPHPVYPIKGWPLSEARKNQKRIWEFKQPMTTSAWHVTVDMFKDRWSYALKKPWLGGGNELQPHTFFNAPINLADKALEELTKERKIRRVGKTGEIEQVWHRPKGSRNELWDLLIYNSAALEIACHAVSKYVFEEETDNWPRFWAYLEAQRAA